MKKVALYVRVSTQEQAAEGYSIQEQTDRLKKYCEAHDWNVVHVYTDPGFSGSNMERPALKNYLPMQITVFLILSWFTSLTVYQGPRKILCISSRMSF